MKPWLKRVQTSYFCFSRHNFWPTFRCRENKILVSSCVKTNSASRRPPRSRKSSKKWRNMYCFFLNTLICIKILKNDQNCVGFDGFEEICLNNWLFFMRWTTWWRRESAKTIPKVTVVLDASLAILPFLKNSTIIIN